MNRLTLPVVVAMLIALVPVAAAEPDPAKANTILIHTASAVHVVEQLSWQNVTAAQYDGLAHASVPVGAQNVEVEFYPSQGVGRPVGPDGLEDLPPDADGFRHLRINFSALQPNVTADGKYSIGLTYDLSGTSFTFRVRYAVDELVVQAIPGLNFAVESTTLGPFLPAAEGIDHAVLTDVAAGTEYDIRFAPMAAGGAAADLSPWAWGLGGVAVGLAGFWFAARQGWIAAPGRAKKFVKGGTMEPRTMLEARRRTLLAALKELETAHDAREVGDDAYFPLKEEYKQQAVRVMRSLEEKKGGG